MSIIQGKLEDELPKIPDNSIHLIFTDPPYNIGYQYKSYKDKLSDEDYYAWTDEWMKTGFQKLVVGGVFQIITHNKHLQKTIDIGKKYGKFYEVVFWKSPKQPNNTKTFQNFSQPIITFINGDKPRIDNKKYFTNSTDFYTNTPKIERIIFQDASRVDNSLILDKVTNNILFGKEITEKDVQFSMYTMKRNILSILSWDTFVLRSTEFFSDVGIIQHIMNEFFTRFSYIEDKEINLFSWYNNQQGHYSDIDRVYSGSFSKKEAIKEGKVKIHSCQLAIELIIRSIRRFTKTGDTILDFFAGSGTTIVAAKMTNRKGIGIEMDAEYCQTARLRLENIEAEKKNLIHPELKIKKFSCDALAIGNLTADALKESIYFKNPDMDTDINIDYAYPYLYYSNYPEETKSLYNAQEGKNIFILSNTSDFGNLSKYELTPLRFGVFYNKYQYFYYTHCIKGKDTKNRVWNNVYFPRIINWKHKRETLKADGVRPSEVIFLPTSNAYTSNNIRNDWKYRLIAHYGALLNYYSKHHRDEIKEQLVLHFARKIYEPLIAQGDLLRSINLFLGHIAGTL